MIRAIILVCLAATTAMALSVRRNLDAADTVSVRFYGESQCPFCRRFVTDVWQQIWTDPEFKSAIDYDFIAWGNSYFATDECGRGPYDPNERQCWAKKCVHVRNNNGQGGEETTKTIDGSKLNDDDDDDDDDDDCFSGLAVYQHSTKEGTIDVYESCVKDLLGLDAAVQFTYCCEGPNMDDDALDARALMERCVVPKFYANDVCDCKEKRGREIEIANAKATPPHPGVPYVVVDGEAIEDPFEVGKAICSSLKKKGAKVPKACDGLYRKPR